MTGIISGFIKGIKSIGGETVEKSADNVGKIVSGIITWADLVGVKPMTDAQEQKVKQEEANKQREMADLRSQMAEGRDVEQEVEKVRDEKKRKDEEEEKFLKNLERQRENERREREQMNLNVPGNSKKEVAKHQGQRGHKKYAPDPVAMSATGEKSGGID